MSAPWLLLWLEGPLQAWGVDSKFNRRASLDFPSRSAVLGLLCAALGAGGEQKELLARFAPLPQTVIAYNRAAGETALPPELQLRDFHMVGSGYDYEDDWQKLHIPRTSEGTYAKRSDGGVGGQKLTYRYYVQDAAFAVALAVPGDPNGDQPDDLAGALAAALITPCWDLSLGRKCCVPTEFIFQGLHATETAALERAASLAAGKNRVEAFRVLDGDQGGETLTLPDLPLQFGPDKVYAERTITLVRP